MSLTHHPRNEEASKSKLESFCKLREEKRRPIAIPLKVNFISSGRTALVCTLDVSPRGARIHSAGHRFRPGDVIVLQRLIERAHARVVWVGNGSHKQHQVGIECLDIEKVFWKEEKIAPAISSARRLINFRFRR